MGTKARRRAQKPKTPEEAIHQMRLRAMDPGKDVAEFMKITAERAKTYSGVDVSTSSAEEFVRDLKKAGILPA